MSAVCMCEYPKPAKIQGSNNQCCEKCGYWYDTQYGSQPVRDEPIVTPYDRPNPPATTATVAFTKAAADPYRLCECGSGTKFKFCCGAKAGTRPKQAGDVNYLQLCCREVKNRLPDNYGFIILAAPFGENGNRRLNYASSMTRETAIRLLEEFLIKAGGAEDWMQHIK
ncbi:MAG TPA: hypothetical protein VMF06_20110 [Candidatus Limnocylindria bacterium]|nr:hypothetical protein [Candidatus Limnocylindria bacterium]